ncbi:MAG: hypothetical protein R3F30_01135 [Planctomycetota bacterium]
MDFAIIDIGGNLVGPTLGLRALGHRVRYWTNGQDPSVRRIAAWLGAGDGPCLDAEVVVYAASFGDEHDCRLRGLQGDEPWWPDRPLEASVNPRQAEVREAWLDRHLPGPDRLVLVDMGDAACLAPAFTARAGTRLKRELASPPRDAAAPAEVSPFPFLYSPALLEVELAGQLHEVLLDPRERGREPGALFAGTIDHWRYGGLRRRLLDELARARPALPVRVAGDLPLVEAWRALQRHRIGLSLPGRGELCFRHHELAALGVPALALRPFGIRVPPAYRRAFPLRIEELPGAEDMRWFYDRHYHPRRAAEALLAAVGRRGVIPTGAR